MRPKTYQRAGNADHQDASDWILALPNLARPNPGLSPFPAQPAAIAPEGPLAFSQGVWTGPVTPARPGRKPVSGDGRWRGARRRFAHAVGIAKK